MVKTFKLLEKRPGLISVLVIAATLTSCTGRQDKTANRDSQDAAESDRPEPLTKGIAPIGQVGSASPRFSWPALDNVSEYHLFVKDDSGNQIKQSIRPLQAGCSNASTDCSATPAVSYYNRVLTWRVDAVVADQTVPLTGPQTFATPADAVIHPITDNAAVCDVWPVLVYDNYAVLNNIWNAGAVSSDNWSQTIAAEQLPDNRVIASWTYDWLDQSSGVPHAVKAYPEVIYGNKLGTLITGSREQTGLPERIDILLTGQSNGLVRMQSNLALVQ